MRLLALALLLPAAGCASLKTGLAGRPVVVEAEGWAPLESGRAGEAREAAFAEAQRRAVEKAVGVRVWAKSRVEGAVSVERRIEAASAGVIEGYETLSEGARQGLMWVLIRARVRRGTPPRVEAPRLELRIEDPGAERAVRSALAAAGIQAEEGGPGGAVSLAAQRRLLAAPGLAPFLSCRARAVLALERPGSPSWSEPAWAAGLGLDEDSACRAAVERAAALAARGLAQRLTGGGSDLASR